MPFKTGRSLLAFVCLLPLGACSIADILTDVKTDYSLTRNEDDKISSDYLQTILNEILKEKVKTLSKDKDNRSREEEYIEETIHADLLKALYAKGYYNAKIRFSRGQKELSGKYNIDYGQQFHISSIALSPKEYIKNLDEQQIKSAMILDAESVLAMQSTLSQNIRKDSCYFSLDVTNEVYLDQKEHKGQVNFRVDAGRQGHFGNTVFKGNGSVKEEYLRKLVPWKEGDCFRRKKVESYKTTLLQGGLFSRVQIQLPETPDKDGTVPVTIDLRERAQRSVSAGFTYYSDEGLGTVLGWEHRNFLGSAEKLETALNFSSLKQSLDLNFNKPYFLRKNQTLSLTSSLIRQNTDAYDEVGGKVGTSVHRNIGRYVSASTGIDLSVTRIDNKTDDSTNTYGLLSAPQTISYDTRDNKLDPHKGWNLSTAAEPFFDALGESDPFFKMQFSGSGYLSLGTNADIVLAGKAGLGSLWGATLEGIPATEHFYAGGGGSVRGYSYQDVGPQENGDPVGGRSLIDFSVELRSKFTDTIGAIIFVDGASVTAESSPQFRNFAIGSGVGFRYYTGFGPVRFDIATPLTQKEGLDQSYQFYISIGQAF
ncbi:MAG: outer membrane protein assembly factor [Alphaproteobacteria bacterium]|nr:outer membrane protein assembly factor [Alphaproteobacteria bacterium]